MPALILNPDARPAQLHVDANQAKRVGRAWHPFTNIFDPGSRKNDKRLAHPYTVLQ